MAISLFVGPEFNEVPAILLDELDLTFDAVTAITLITLRNASAE